LQGKYRGECCRKTITSLNLAGERGEGFDQERNDCCGRGSALLRWGRGAVRGAAVQQHALTTLVGIHGVELCVEPQPIRAWPACRA
jgi:hypothetical protein